MSYIIKTQEDKVDHDNEVHIRASSFRSTCEVDRNVKDQQDTGPSYKNYSEDDARKFSNKNLRIKVEMMQSRES